MIYRVFHSCGRCRYVDAENIDEAKKKSERENSWRTKASYAEPYKKVEQL